jgi:ubiquinone/menaquinone biosynthesis C-methylase UbiE
VGFYGEHIVPRLTDLTLNGRPFDCLRAVVTTDLEGEVLEIGFGSGRNLPHYPRAVGRLRAVEPSAVGRKLAAARVAASPVPVEFVGLDGQELPVEDASIDHALTTWTLCTIPDVARALDEVRRVLKPRGRFHFVEHGRAPDPRVARWQDRLTPIQRRVAGGCHLNRSIGELVTAAGLVLERLDHPRVPGPRAFTYTYEGVATRR